MKQRLLNARLAPSACRQPRRGPDAHRRFFALLSSPSLSCAFFLGDVFGVGFAVFFAGCRFTRAMACRAARPTTPAGATDFMHSNWLICHGREAWKRALSNCAPRSSATEARFCPAPRRSRRSTTQQPVARANTVRAWSRLLLSVRVSSQQMYGVACGGMACAVSSARAFPAGGAPGFQV